MVLVTVAYAVATMTALSLAGRCWSRRHASPVVPLVGVIGASQAVWLTVELFVPLADDPGVAAALRTAALICATASTSSFFALAWHLFDRTWVPTRGVVALMCLEPVLVIAAAVTNRWHHLFLIDTHRRPDGLGFEPGWGPLYWWVHFPYLQFLTVIALSRLVRMWSAADRGRRVGYLMIVVGVLPPIAANAVWLTGLYQTVNLTPLAMTFTLGVGYHLIARRVLDHGPIAHRRVFEAVNDAVIVTDPQGRILDANPAAVLLSRRVRSASAEPLIGRMIEGGLAALINGEAAESGEGEREVVLRRAWGIDLDVQVRVCRLLDRRGAVLGWTFVGRDITELNRGQNELRLVNERLTEQLRVIEALRADLAEQTVRDPLTGLYNRRHLMARLAGETESGGRPMSLAVIDIDHFKRVNDQYGHSSGDQVLIRVARLLLTGVGPADVLARHGGEEFVLFMPDTPGPRAWARVDGLRRLLAATPVEVDGHRLRVTMSAGVASRVDGEPRTALLQTADQALYQAKRRGRDQVILFGHGRVPHPAGGPRGAREVTKTNSLGLPATGGGTRGRPFPHVPKGA